MKKLFVFFLLIFTGCATMGQNYLGTKYKYSYSLLESNSSDLSWSDSNLRVAFTITDKEIAFSINNVSDQSMKIIWDESSLALLGIGQKIMHKGVKYIDRNGPQPPTTIPPRVLVQDFIVPVENVRWHEGYYSRYGSSPGRWETDDLLPVHDLNREDFKNTILSSKGQKIILYLPVEIGASKKIYSFTFQVTDVQPVQI